jgi:putative DNA-invertase from lambdoid prophage Rac
MSIRERVKTGLYRAAEETKKIGRQRVTTRRGFDTRYKMVLERLTVGDISRRRAAKELGIGYATLKRLLDRGKNKNTKRQIKIAEKSQFKQ